MKRHHIAIAILASVGLLAVACGVDPTPGATPTPPREPGPAGTPTPGPFEPSCFSTEAYALEHLVAVIGEDTIPTRFDAINGGGCEFDRDIKEIRIELTGNGSSQTAVYPFPVPVRQVRVPFDDTMAGPVIDSSLTPGLYERRVVAVAKDGSATEIPGFEPVILVRDPESVQARLLRAESRWQRSGVTSYVYEASWRCFCPMEYVAPVNVTVVDGVATEIGFADPGQAGEVPSPERFGAIERHFEFLQEAINQGAAAITVEFHELGYPTSVFVDYHALTIDEEQGFAITSLEMR